MKLHRNLIYGVVTALDESFNKGEYADKAIERILKTNKKWGSRDRGFVAETVYDIVRWKRRLTEAAGINDPGSTPGIWKITAAYLVVNGYELPDWEEFENINPKKIKEKYENQSALKIVESIPDWLDEIGRKELSGRWEDEISALNSQAPLVIRVNTLKMNKQKLKELLMREGVESRETPLAENALVIEEKQNIFRLDLFKKGYFEVQDAASQNVAPFTEPTADMRIVDACAGAGGKTLHLAALMENKGKIIAMDVEAWKLRELKKRARRNGVHNVEAKVIDSTKIIKRMKGQADRVLLDVPCSGLGVLRRNPDSKWKISPERIEEIKKQQAEIISAYSGMVKKGGKLIYATCSILPSENRVQVDKFIESQPGEFELEEEKILSPSKDGFDGFYMARLAQKSK